MLTRMRGRRGCAGPSSATYATWSRRKRLTLLPLVALALAATPVSSASAEVQQFKGLTRQTVYPAGFTVTMEAWVNIDYTNHKIRAYGEDRHDSCGPETLNWRQRAALVMGSYDPYVDDAYNAINTTCDIIKSSALVSCLISPQNYSTYHGLEVRSTYAYGLRSSIQSTTCGG